MTELRKVVKQACNGATIHFNFFSDPIPSTPTVIAFPGGPGLSNRYMHPFLFDLAVSSGWNVALVDLPNHDQSTVSPTLKPLTYEACTKLLTSSLNTFFHDFQKIVFLGQSLGSRIALDLLSSVDLKVSKSILINCPSRFEVSSEFQRRFERLSLTSSEIELCDELAFKTYWEKVCPLNLYAAVSKEDLDSLTSTTKWEGNETFLEKAPTLEDTVRRMGDFYKGSELTFIQGRHDPILIENNLEIIRSLLPQAKFYFIEKSGHFPMVENKYETQQIVLQELMAS